MLDDLWYAAYVGSDGHHLAGHRFQGCQSKGFQFAWKKHDIGQRQLFMNMILLAQKHHLLMDAFLHGQPFGLGAVRAIPDEQKFRRDLLTHAIENLNHV